MLGITREVPEVKQKEKKRTEKESKPPATPVLHYDSSSSGILPTDLIDTYQNVNLSFKKG